ncbi:MAG: hypothetical protein JWQ49_4402 [Edaphobacter sp.]|nr:hypothetical protein [Edaphobacter sp.]
MKNFARFAAASLACTAVLSILSIAQINGKSGTGYRLQNRFPIEGSDSWGYITVDSNARRVYVSQAFASTSSMRIPAQPSTPSRTPRGSWHRYRLLL